MLCEAIVNKALCTLPFLVSAPAFAVEPYATIPTSAVSTVNFGKLAGSKAKVVVGTFVHNNDNYEIACNSSCALRLAGTSTSAPLVASFTEVTGLDFRLATGTKLDMKFETYEELRFKLDGSGPAFVKWAKQLK